MNKTFDLPALLLVGGMGTRLRSAVPSTPKALASVGNQPFLQLLVRQLRAQGIRRLVLCTGYLADQIEEAFGDGRAFGVEISYSREPVPLGTAGAVKLARPRLNAAPDFLVMNGDSFLQADLRDLIRFHYEHEGLVSMAVLPVPNAQRYGSVRVGAGSRVFGFTEKTDAVAPALVNAGVYIFKQDIFGYIPEGQASLERDVFPRLLDNGVYAQEQHGMFIDIGTPEDYARAQELAAHLSEAAANRK